MIHDLARRAGVERRPEYYGPSWTPRAVRRPRIDHWVVIYRGLPGIADPALSEAELVQALTTEFVEAFGVPITGPHLTVCVELWLCQVKRIPHGRPRCQMATAWVEAWLSTAWSTNET